MPDTLGIKYNTVVSYDCNFVLDDIYNLEVYLKLDDVSAFQKVNYAVIPDLNLKYFVEPEQKYTSAYTVNCHLKCDFLNSFETEIKASQAHFYKISDASKATTRNTTNRKTISTYSSNVELNNNLSNVLITIGGA